MLYKGEYNKLSKEILFSMVTCLMVSILLSTLLFFTFGYLQIKSLSFIPILSLLVLAAFFVLLILNFLRYKVIKKVNTGLITIDREFLRLHIIAFKASREEQ